MSNQMGLTGYDFIEFYVGSAKMVAYWYAKAMGFDVKGYSGPEYGRRDRTSYYLTKNQIKLVITSGLQPDTYDVASFVTKHGDGVKRWALSVNKDFATTIGPWLVTPDELENYKIKSAEGSRYDIQMTAKHNGKQISNGNMKSID